jgi:hypothetical protein
MFKVQKKSHRLKRNVCDDQGVLRTPAKAGVALPYRMHIIRINRWLIDRIIHPPGNSSSGARSETPDAQIKVFFQTSDSACYSSRRIAHV